MPRPTPDSSAPADGLAFLLSQVGAHSSVKYAERLEPLGFKPADVGIMRVIRQSDGLSQQALGEKLAMFPSRLVGIIDELERKGLVERRNSPTDRRSYALFLTQAGQKALVQIGKVSREHQDSVCAALNDAERVQLADLLRRIVAQQGLTPGVHPGFGKNREECK
jgi:DNA-binding MarR family transcriptional regulator